MNTVFDPSKHPSYKTQFDKLTRAYIANDVKPYDACACFIGNLLNNSNNWCFRDGSWDERFSVNESFRSIIEQTLRLQAGGLYTPEEIFSMEALFLKTFSNRKHEDFNYQESEQSLFDAFCVTLDLLKQIHESKGEVITETLAFNKRELNPVP